MKPKRDNLRISMESSVIGVNRHLTEKVKSMSTHELLMNMHPGDAEYYSVSKKK